MFITTAERIKAAREGADTERFHTTRTVRRQSVGLHSFNMITMLMILFPPGGTPSRNLIYAIVQHDIPERWIGDIPAPAKWWGVMEEGVAFRTEQMLNEAIFDAHYTTDLSEQDLGWLAGLDILECICEMKDELLMGNLAVEKLYVRAVMYAKENAAKFPKEIVDAVYAVDHDDWAPVKELGE